MEDHSTAPLQGLAPTRSRVCEGLVLSAGPFARPHTCSHTSTSVPQLGHQQSRCPVAALTAPAGGPASILHDRYTNRGQFPKAESVLYNLIGIVAQWVKLPVQMLHPSSDATPC